MSFIRPYVAPSGFSLPYYTTFPSNENPISEGGIWTRNASNTIWHPILTSGGYAFASQYSTSDDDCYSYINNWTYGNNYEIIATVARLGLAGGEIEMLLRVSDTATTVQCYECLYNVAGSWQILRWNGALHDFVDLSAGGGGVPGTAQDGNQIRATIVGSTITMYWRQVSTDAWSQLAQITDSNIASGAPGMGIFVRSVDNNLTTTGFADYQVTLL